MHKDKFVFAQLVSFLDRNKFNYIVRRYDGDKYVKHFTCWNQLLALMFGRLSNRESLRDLIVALEAHHSKCYHLGMGRNVSKSSFHITKASVHDSKAMNEIYYEQGSYYIFDQDYNKFKMLYTIHRIGAYFFVGAKKNLQYEPLKWKRRLPQNVLSDMFVELTGFYPKLYYPEPLRLVRYWDEDQKREFVFLTNAMSISALQIAELYKNRWQIELFFKWLKQHLKIKKFRGTIENAVRIQIYSAICAYCLVAIIQ